MYSIIENKMLVPNLHQMIVNAPDVAQAAQPGNFVIIRAEEDGERIPLSISDWDRDNNTITLIYINVGKTTDRLSSMEPGSQLATVVGPLGNEMEIDNYGTVMCVAGCYGIGSLFPVARALHEKGNNVITLIEARSSTMLYWLEKHRKTCDTLVVLTRDGSKGTHGHMNSLPGIIASLSKFPDRIIINGCNYLMMRGCEETRAMNIKTIVSLNTLMIDGTGMCGVCRVTVNSQTKFACVDGPHFDGHLVDWDELAQRRKAYLCEEVTTLRSSAPHHP
jgi:ferredoxin--NADP+ reductase